MANNKSKAEFKKFDSLASSLIRVPHSEIKAKLDAEKAAKKKTKKEKKRNDR